MCTYTDSKRYVYTQRPQKIINREMKRLKLKRNKELLKSLLLFMWLTNGLQITVGDTWK